MPERAEPTYPTPELRTDLHAVRQRRLSAATYAAFRVIKVRSPQVKGLERIRDGETANFVASHRQDADIPLAHLPIRQSGANTAVVVPTKEEYWYQSVGPLPLRAPSASVRIGDRSWSVDEQPISVGRLMEHGGSVPVSNVRDDRPDKVVNDTTNLRFYKAATAALKSGDGALWFGEGHRYSIDDHEIHELGAGVSRAARSTGVGVRTIGIAYAENPLDWRKDAAVVVGEWIDPPTKGDDLEEYSMAIQFGIQRAYNEALEMLEIEPTHPVPAE